MTNAHLKSAPTNWQVVRNWIFDQEGEHEYQRRQIYALTDWIYQDLHFAMRSVYEWPSDLSEGPTDLSNRHERDVMNVYMAMSRDGDTWDLTAVYEQQPIIERGGDGSFDKDLLLPTSPIVTCGDKHWLYYAGADERHGTPDVVFPRKHAIGLATLRLDGFVSLTADAEGTLVTKPFVLKGEMLEFNVAAGNGSICVEVLDANEKPMVGFAEQDAKLKEHVDALR